jgi:predicted nucleic acid-binding protein
MTASDVPPNPSVLNTTVLSNFASIDRVEVLARLSGICTVPVVREELEAGVADHPYLSPAVDAVEERIPVAPIAETVGNREAIVRGHLDPGEAQAFALADVHDGRLLTDDGDARSFSKEQGVTVVGSVGVLLAAIDDGRIDEPTANEWLTTWIDDFGYYVPSRDISEYR